MLPELPLIEEQPVTGFIASEVKRKQVTGGKEKTESGYVSGQYCGMELKRSPKLC